MKETTRNLLVGLFVVLSLAALAVLMVWFGETPSWLRTSEWDLRIAGVHELGGIGEGSPVNLSGVEIGRVKHLEFVDKKRPDRGVDIIAGIQRQYCVPSGATARVYGATLGFGTGRVEIIVERGLRGEPLPQDGTASLRGEMRSVIGELISKDMVASLERTINHIGNLTAEWTPVGTNLAQLLEQRSIADINTLGEQGQTIVPNLSTAIERVDRLAANLNTLLGDEHVQEDVKAVVKDLHDTSTELKQLVQFWRGETQKITENVNTGIDRTEENLEDSFAQLTEILEQLDDTARSLAVVLQHVENGEGTAGLLIRDDRLYEAAVLTLERSADVLLNLQIITGKMRDDGYITVGKAPTGLLKARFPLDETQNKTD
ncbi:MAG: MCE family protein [Phycisphaerales bacterium]|nr:MAG: MCE family protein [Phycisphaerales bacterium]